MKQLKRSLKGSLSRKRDGMDVSKILKPLSGEQFTSAFLIGTGAIGVAVLAIGLVSGIRSLTNGNVSSSNYAFSYQNNPYSSPLPQTSLSLIHI